MLVTIIVYLLVGLAIATPTVEIIRETKAQNELKRRRESWRLIREQEEKVAAPFLPHL